MATFSNQWDERKARRAQWIGVVGLVGGLAFAARGFPVIGFIAFPYAVFVLWCTTPLRDGEGAVAK